MPHNTTYYFYRFYLGIVDRNLKLFDITAFIGGYPDIPKRPL